MLKFLGLPLLHPLHRYTGNLYPPSMRLIVTALVLILATSAASAETIAGHASVIDGDTIEIRGQRIRLHGIDAPELYQSCEDAQGVGYPCGIAAKGMLIAEMGGSTISCEGKDRDRYGRLIAICRTIDGINLGAAMVRDGWAVAFLRYSRAYVGEEAAARAIKTGLWAGTFMMPWDWRKTH